MNTDEPLQVFENRPFQEIYARFGEQPRLELVPTIDQPTHAEFHHEIFPAHYPVVYRDVSQPLICDDLVRALGNCKELIKVSIGNYAKPTNTDDVQYESVPLSHYVDRYLFACNQGSPPYAGNIALDSAILKELGSLPPNYYRHDAFETATVWLGATGCVTRLHKDGSKNFAIHRFGQKRWTLFPPRDAELLYPSRLLPHSDFAVSAVDLRHVDDERFPLFRQAQSVTVTVDAGHVLYLPEGWFHYVENLAPTLMVNYWHKRST